MGPFTGCGQLAHTVSARSTRERCQASRHTSPIKGQGGINMRCDTPAMAALYNTPQDENAKGVILAGLQYQHGTPCSMSEYRRM